MIKWQQFLCHNDYSKNIPNEIKYLLPFVKSTFSILKKKKDPSSSTGCFNILDKQIVPIKIQSCHTYSRCCSCSIRWHFWSGDILAKMVPCTQIWQTRDCAYEIVTLIGFYLRNLWQHLEWGSESVHKLYL